MWREVCALAGALAASGAGLGGEDREEPDLYDYYEEEVPPPRATIQPCTDVDALARVRRYGDKSFLRTLDPDEIDDVKGALKQLFAGRNMGESLISNAYGASDSSPDFMDEVSTELFEDTSPIYMSIVHHTLVPTRSTRLGFRPGAEVARTRHRGALRDDETTTTSVAAVTTSHATTTTSTTSMTTSSAGTTTSSAGTTTSSAGTTASHAGTTTSSAGTSPSSAGTTSSHAGTTTSGAEATTSSPEDTIPPTTSQDAETTPQDLDATTTSGASTTTTTTRSTTKSPRFDIEALLAIVANLTYGYDMNLTYELNETLQRFSIPTCKTPTTTITTTTLTTTEVFYNTTVISKCFVCGLQTPGIPRNAFCADAFATDFLPLVPIDPRAKGMIARYRKYCRYFDVNNYQLNKSDPRALLGRWTGGCAVRWIDLSGVYTQRVCRNRLRPLTGLHFASKRMAKLELALSNVDDGCIISPMATLVPLSRGISLYARFHACVCTGSWCNGAQHLALGYITLLLYLLIILIIK